MTLPQKDYYCKDCILTFEADYDDSVQRPRRACPKCHKVVDIKKNKTRSKVAIKSSKSRDSSIVTDSETQGKGGNGSSPLIKYTKIDDDMIEELILKKANSGEDLSDNFIKTCIQFYKDIRGKDDKIKDDIPMEELMAIGESLKSSN